MSAIDNYLNKLKTYFDEEDIGAYNDLKEDLMMQLEECMLEGMTEEEAVTTFSNPEIIVEDYFLDRSLETAEKAKTYVIPKEEIKSVYYQTQKHQWKKWSKKIVKLLKRLTMLFLILIIMISVCYIFQEFYYERHIAKIPLISLLLATGSLLFYIQKEVKLLLVSKIALIGGSVFIAIIFQLTGKLLYDGIDYYKKFSLTEDENINFILQTGPNIEVTTVSVDKEMPFEFILKGKYTKKDIQQLEKNIYNNKVSISLNTNTLSNIFTSNEKKEIILFIPEKKKISLFSIESSDGDLRLLDFETDKLDIDLKEGDIYMKNILVQTGKIKSFVGDFILEESQGELKINNEAGKNIITNFEGNLDIKSISGVSILKNLNSDKVKIKSNESRLVIDESSVNKLDVKSLDGQQVVKNTTGDLSVETYEGRIVAENVTGKVKLKTSSGPIISIQTSVIDADVYSDTGFIKWLQSRSTDISIDSYVGGRKIDNQFSNSKTSKSNVKIVSQSGSVKVMEKVD